MIQFQIKKISINQELMVVVVLFIMVSVLAIHVEYPNLGECKISNQQLVSRLLINK